MKIIEREELPKIYKLMVKDEPSFPQTYTRHGSMTECNWGGLIITLNNDQSSCFVVRDWGGDDLHISSVLCEIDFFPNSKDGEDEQWRPGFYIDNEQDDLPYLLEEFMII